MSPVLGARVALALLSFLYSEENAEVVVVTKQVEVKSGCSYVLLELLPTYSHLTHPRRSDPLMSSSHAMLMTVTSHPWAYPLSPRASLALL